MRTGGERTMLQMIDVTDRNVGSLLRGKAFDWIFLGKRPKRNRQAEREFRRPMLETDSAYAA